MKIRRFLSEREGKRRMRGITGPAVGLDDPTATRPTRPVVGEEWDKTRGTSSVGDDGETPERGRAAPSARGGLARRGDRKPQRRTPR